MKRTALKIQNESNAKALKRARVTLALSRKEVAYRMKISAKTIEKYENARGIIPPERVLQMLEVMKLSPERFKKIKKGKAVRPRGPKEKRVFCNEDRRSYRRIITKECRVLRSLRRQKNLSQDEASRVCGYSRATIGHIENGRIELSLERIKHIVKSYGWEQKDFDNSLGKEELRDEVIDYCIDKINGLDEVKLGVVKGLLGSL